MRALILVALLAVFPTLLLAQDGRAFTALKSDVALGETVRVGKIIKFEEIHYAKPLVGVQGDGKQYRLTFKVEETIRGKKAPQVELVLALQNPRFLQYMRAHGSTVLLVGGPNPIDGDPEPEVGVEEDGKSLNGYRYQFRFLDMPSKSERAEDPAMAKQILITFNEGRMFTIDLAVVQGRDAILRHLRAFAKKDKERTQGTWLGVPKDFASLVGYPNAFSFITLPVCPETERLLVSILRNPRVILDRIGPQTSFGDDAQVIAALKSLAPFPSKANAQLVRKFAGDYNPAVARDDAVYSIKFDVQRTAWQLLQTWNL